MTTTTRYQVTETAHPDRSGVGGYCRTSVLSGAEVTRLQQACEAARFRYENFPWDGDPAYTNDWCRYTRIDGVIEFEIRPLR